MGLRNGGSVFFLLLLFLTACFILSIPTTTAQEANPETWEKGYGESGSVFFDAAETETGYILAGNTKLEGARGAGASSNTVGWVVKTNRSGEVVWRKVFEDRRGSSLYGVTRTDYGYVAVGIYDAESLLNLRQAWAVGLSEEGGVKWISDSFRGRDRFDDVVSIGDDEDTVAVGTGKGRRQYAVRFDGQGEVLWQTTYADGNLRSVTKEGLVFAGKGEKNYGRIESAQVTDVNPDGSTEWQRFYNETSVNFRQGNPGGEDIVALGDGYAVASGDRLIRTGPDGEPRWTVEISQGGVISALAPTEGDEVLTAVKIGDDPGVLGPGEARGRLLWVDRNGVQRTLDRGLEGDLGQIREIIPLSNGYYHLSGTESANQGYSHRGYGYVTDLRPPDVEPRVTPEEDERSSDTQPSNSGRSDTEQRGDATSDTGETRGAGAEDGNGNRLLWFSILGVVILAIVLIRMSVSD